MKLSTKLLSLTTALILLGGCNPTDIDNTGETPEPPQKAEISISVTDIEIGAEAFSSGETAIVTNQNEVTAKSDQAWLNVSVKNSKLKVIATEDNDSGAERSATVTVTAGKDDNTASASVTVRQKFIEKTEEPTTLTVSATEVELGIEANSTSEITFESNKEVILSIPEDAEEWLKVEMSNSTITFTSLTENKSGSPFTTTVGIYAGAGEYLMTEQITVTQKSVVYEIGQFYEGGIIFDVASDYIKVVSLNTTTAAWGPEGLLVGGCSDEEDGSINTAAVTQNTNYSAENFPAFAWCLGLGEGWYFAAARELQKMADNIDAINNGLKENGGTSFDSVSLTNDTRKISEEYHWASAEKSEKNAIAVRPSDKAATNYSKGGKRYVRAVKKIAR